jgi:XTP/dITP diphosphohydrolase
MVLTFATNNTYKVDEVRQILAGTGVEVRTLAEAGLDVDPPETGDTFEANALQKARFVHALTGGWVVADDSGIEVDALGGAPGVFSKRFASLAGRTGPEEATNNALLLERLAGRTDRRARFRCVIAVVGEGIERTADGRCEGSIALEPRGANGFGYDPLFLPDEVPGVTMAELDMAAKNAISHRGRAFRELPGMLP